MKDRIKNSFLVALVLACIAIFCTAKVVIVNLKEENKHLTRAVKNLQEDLDKQLVQQLKKKKRFGHEDSR